MTTKSHELKNILRTIKLTDTFGKIRLRTKRDVPTVWVTSPTNEQMEILLGVRCLGISDHPEVNICKVWI